MHLQPGHPSRDANALHPPLLRGITVTQPGCLCPSRGLSHPPPPPGRVLPLPRTPSSAQRRGRKPRRFPGRGMRVCPSWSWSQLTLPTPEGSPPPPRLSPFFWDIQFSWHSTARRPEAASLSAGHAAAVPWRPRLCRRLKGWPRRVAAVYTGVGGPRCWPVRAELLPALLSLPARRARRARFGGRQPHPPVPEPTVHRDGGAQS